MVFLRAVLTAVTPLAERSGFKAVSAFLTYMLFPVQALGAQTVFAVIILRAVLT